MSAGSKWMASFLVAACLVAVVPIGEPFQVQARTAGSSKIAPDLTELIRKGQGHVRQKLIIQYDDTLPLQIDYLLPSLGGVLKRQLNKLKIRIVDLPLNAVAALASRKEVQYISLDRPVDSFGHIESTTGTAAIRTQTTTSLLGLITSTTVYDGHGIGIAILDSGIDAQHVSFRDQLGLSRVVLSRDFTGENRTDDAYGHGTHVASIAAGNGEISSGAYTGIASDAKLINLRILNSQGQGATSNVLAALDWIMTYRGVYGIRVVNM
ncbi:MAG TPA: S8 family serine peptidase, partial [Pyrinomonadaceae bacterium]|nr:S8 family serine peptidase [Pyrinomonadaceae bacterium]